MQLFLLLLIVGSFVIFSSSPSSAEVSVDLSASAATEEEDATTDRESSSTTTATATATPNTNHRDDIHNLLAVIRQWLEHYVVLQPITLSNITITGYDQTGSRFHLSPFLGEEDVDDDTSILANDVPIGDQLTLALTSVRGFTRFVQTIFDGCSSHSIPGGGCWNNDDIIDAFQEMASRPLKDYVNHTEEQHKQQHDGSSSFSPADSGGGSGSGFQIFCYNTAVLSTGGGGGGGVHPEAGNRRRSNSGSSSNESSKYGGDNLIRKVAGYGAGMQIRLGPGMDTFLPDRRRSDGDADDNTDGDHAKTTTTTISWGGGLQYPDTSKLYLDYDAVDCHTFCYVFDHLIPILRQCYLDGHLRVEGGGGGGGGVTLLYDDNRTSTSTTTTGTKNRNKINNKNEINGQHVFSSGFGFGFKIFGNNYNR